MEQLKVSVIGTGPVGLAIASRLAEVSGLLTNCLYVKMFMLKKVTCQLMSHCEDFLSSRIMRQV